MLTEGTFAFFALLGEKGLFWAFLAVFAIVVFRWFFSLSGRYFEASEVIEDADKV